MLADPEPVIVDVPEEVRTGGPGGGGPPNFDSGGGGGDDDDHEAEGDGQQKAAGVGLFAIQCVLVSITALFVTIGIVYFVRSRSANHWTAVGAPSFLWLSTALILGSSVTMEAARRSFLRSRIDGYARWLLTTFFLGLAFLISQLLALRQLLGQGVYLRHNPHSSLFYVVTGAHGAHLLGGMAALFYLVIRSSLRMRDVRSELERMQTMVRTSTLYWHFLDGLWVVLFVLLLAWS